MSGATPLLPLSAFMVWTAFCIRQDAEMEVQKGAVLDQHQLDSQLQRSALIPVTLPPYALCQPQPAWTPL